MAIMYISSAFSNKDVDEIFNDKGLVPYAANKYNKLLCEGIAKNGIEVYSISLLPITRSNCNKLFVKGKRLEEGTLKRCYLSVVNIPVIKHLFRAVSVFFKVLFAPKNTSIIFDVFAISANVAMTVAAKIRGFQRICIVTDLPEILITRKLSLNLHNFVMKKATGYVLLTKQMSDKVNPFCKKEVIVEGVADSELTQKESHVEKGGARKIMYAGSLQKMYGVDKLLDAFLEICKENEEIHIFGSGDYADEISVTAKKNKNVVYHGSCSNEKVLIAEQEATLLVNPRSGEGEYTKYSFPSKVMEYMSSGTPVLMAKLPGIPDDYYNYCYTFDDKNPESLKQAIRMALDKEDKELSDLGDKAKSFVLKEKNNVMQAKKIVDMFSIN